MGTSNSCLPISFNNLCCRSSVAKVKHDHDQQPIESINKNNNKINLNNVPEDELLFLPGITRQLAQNIVQYREMNNGFKQIDEILKVDGIHYDLFQSVCFDISTGSSSSLLNSREELVNLNLASYNDLCLIPGLTPNLVTQIIQYRKRKGLFRFVEDLLQIKDIDYVVLATVRPHVTVNQPQMSTLTINTIDSPTLASLVLRTLTPEFQTKLLSSFSRRPSTINEIKERTFRFASWNLQQLTNDKVQNPGVKEVICRVILEHNFSLIGIQEIGDKESLNYIVQELNNPTIPFIKDLPNRPYGEWKFTISDKGSEYLGFLYDESIGIELKKASLLSLKTSFTQSPYMTIFRLYDKIDLVFVNMHLKEENKQTKDESLSAVTEAIKDTIAQKHIIIFGDFNIVPTAAEFEALVKCNYSNVIEQNTDISLTTPQGSTCMDNIWLSTNAKALTTGKSGVIRDNLTSVWIPAGWSWGGLVSDHCPIWIEFDLSQLFS